MKRKILNILKYRKKMVAGTMTGIMAGVMLVGSGMLISKEFEPVPSYAQETENVESMIDSRVKHVEQIHEEEEIKKAEEKKQKEEAERKAREEAEKKKQEEEAKRQKEEKQKQEAQQRTYSEPTPAWNGSVLTPAMGVNYGPSGKETYYNLPMDGVISIMRGIGNNDAYWVRDDGCKMLGDYIMVAADLSVRPRGSLVETSLGTGIVCDTGTFIYSNSMQIDIATAW